MKDWERHGVRACPERQFCDKHSNVCCYWCDAEPLCDVACAKIDFSKNIPDVCATYKIEYSESD